MVKYTICHDHAEVSSHSGSDNSIVIKDTFDKLPVTVIAKDAFIMSSIKSITLPKTLKKIKAAAFMYCKRLTSIHIPEGTEILGYQAFCNCEHLKTVDIPETIKVLNRAVFNECDSLESIRLPDSIQRLYATSLECESLKTIDIPCTFIRIYLHAFIGVDILQRIIVRFGASDDWLGTAVRIFNDICTEVF